MRTDEYFDWRIRAILEKLLFGVLFGKRTRYLLKRYIVRSIPYPLESYIEHSFPDVYQTFKHHYFDRLDFSMDSTNYFEIGAGEHLITPMIMYIGGAHVNVVDIDYVLDFHFMKYAFTSLKRILTESSDYIDGYNMITQRIESLDDIFQSRGMHKMDLVKALGEAGIKYFVAKKPNYADFLKPGSVDLVTAKSVLEHVPLPELRNMLLHLRKVLKQDGVLWFKIDMKDHWSRYRNSSDYNYLKYSDFAWNLLYNNRNIYQNRLSVDEYYRLFTDYGYTRVFSHEDVSDESQLEHLKDIKINKRFQDYTLKRLMVRRITVLLKN